MEMLWQVSISKTRISWNVKFIYLYTHSFIHYVTKGLFWIHTFAKKNKNSKRMLLKLRHSN